MVISSTYVIKISTFLDIRSELEVTKRWSIYLFEVSSLFLYVFPYHLPSVFMEKSLAKGSHVFLCAQMFSFCDSSLILQWIIVCFHITSLWVMLIMLCVYIFIQCHYCSMSVNLSQWTVFGYKCLGYISSIKKKAYAKWLI